MDVRLVFVFGIVAIFSRTAFAKAYHHRTDPCNVKYFSSRSGSEPMSFCRGIEGLVHHAENMRPHAEQIQNKILKLSQNSQISLFLEYYDAVEESFIDISLCEPKPMYLHEMFSSIWTLMYDLRDLVDYITCNGTSGKCNDDGKIAQNHPHVIFSELRNLFIELSGEWDRATCFLSNVLEPRLQPIPYQVPKEKRLNYDDDDTGDELLRAYIVAKDFTRTMGCLEGLKGLTSCHCQTIRSSL